MKLAQTRVQPRTPLFNFRWWMPGTMLFVVAGLVLAYAASRGQDGSWLAAGNPTWWVVTTLLHIPFVGILFFLDNGHCRAGRLRSGRGAPRSCRAASRKRIRRYACSCPCSTNTPLRGGGSRQRPPGPGQPTG
ncbi:hypothetical protein HC891_26320 [Candidatus Gracilibacteria bacterium]|nr:hypothetical protein [Candidatus Gracilibacteria bacterium]